MSQVNELLNTMAEEEIVAYTADPENEPHIVIGKDRIIKVPEELRRIAVEDDHNVETVTFDCPRYWDEHDLTEMVLYIRYACPDGKPGGYIAQNVRVDDTATDMIHFEWTISENVTGKAGTLAIMVVAKKSDEESGESINRWHSEPNTEMYISKGIPGEDIDYATGNPDLLTQALLLTDKLLSAEWMAVRGLVDGDVVFAQKTINLANGSIVSGFKMKLEIGLMYNVYWNNVKYTCTAYEEDEQTFLGNGSLTQTGQLEDTGEPFLISGWGGTSNSIYTSDTNLKINLKIVMCVNGPIKLPQEYLTDGVVKSVNGVAPDENGAVTIDTDDTGVVKSVNGIKPNSTGNVVLQVAKNFVMEASIDDGTIDTSVMNAESAYNTGMDIVLKCTSDYTSSDGTSTGTNTVFFKLYQRLKIGTEVRYFFQAPLSETENAIVQLISQTDGSFALSYGADE